MKFSWVITIPMMHLHNSAKVNSFLFFAIVVLPVVEFTSHNSFCFSKAGRVDIEWSHLTSWLLYVWASYFVCVHLFLPLRNRINSICIPVQSWGMKVIMRVSSKCQLLASSLIFSYLVLLTQHLGHHNKSKHYVAWFLLIHLTTTRTEIWPDSFCESSIFMKEITWALIWQCWDLSFDGRNKNPCLDSCLCLSHINGLVKIEWWPISLTP